MQSGKSIVRPAVVEDAAKLASLVELYWAFESIPHFDRTGVERLLAELLIRPEWGACWVAEESGALRGYLLVVYGFSLEYGGRTAELDELYVLPAHRSAGHGAALLREAERALRVAGMVSVQLQLGIANDQARTF